MVDIPYIIFGTVSESGTGVDSAFVKARNERTSELISTIANGDGLYVMDASNFTSGYSNGDKVTIYTIYQNFDGQTTITVAQSEGGSQVDIALSEAADNTEINYCTVQDVYDGLDNKTQNDISTERIIKEIQRAEGVIDGKTQTSFQVNTVTDKVYTVQRYTIDMSPDMLDTVNRGMPVRADSFTGGILNRVKVEDTPIIAISSLSINSGSTNGADSWTALTEQTGSGGNYMVEDKDVGNIDFIDNFPRFGKRSWKITHTWGYDPDSTDIKVKRILKVVNRLCTLLASKYIITTKSTGAMFDSIQDIRIDVIEIGTGGQSTAQYLKAIDTELISLWNILGDLGLEVI